MIRKFLGYQPGESLFWDALIGFIFVPAAAVCLWAAIPACDALWLSRFGAMLTVGSLLILQRTQSLQTRRIYKHLESFLPHATSSDLRLSRPHHVIQGIAIATATVGTALWGFSDIGLQLVCSK